MILLVLLLAVYLLLAPVTKYCDQVNLSKIDRGCIALSVMFLFTGIFHFIIKEKLIAMIPAFIPWRLEIITLTGIMEIAFAIGFLFPRFRSLTGKVSIVFLIVVFSSNVYGALTHVDLAGHVYGPIYLLFRLPLQIFLIIWTAYFSLRKDEKSRYD